MENKTILFFQVAFVLYIVGIIEGISLINTKGKVKTVISTIIDIQLAAPETMKIHNSKWAKVSYYVNGKRYVSENRIAVSMYNEIGDKISVRYFIDQPQKLYSRSKKRLIIILLVAIVCTLIGFYTI